MPRIRSFRERNRKSADFAQPIPFSNIFMSTTKTIAIVTTVAALFALGLAFHQYNEIQQARPAQTAADLAQKDFRQRLSASADMIKSLQAQVGFLQGQLATLAARAADPALPPSSTTV